MLSSPHSLSDIPKRFDGKSIHREDVMFKIMAILFIMIAPTLMGVLVVGVLSMSSPTTGGISLSAQGNTILMVVVGAAIAALPISYIIAGKITRTLNS